MEKKSYANVVGSACKSGFTLAEVLITLGIIGVVAAITIPTLMNKTQNQEYVSGLKKAYSMTNQALQQLMADRGCVGDLVCTGLFSSTSTNEAFGQAYAKYFNISKDCGNTNSTTGCLPNPFNANFDGKGSNYTNANQNTDYKFITTDGMSFSINSLAPSTPDCGWSFSANKTKNMTAVCGSIMVDVNGLKKPNMQGRDIFYFYITNGKGAVIYPQGGIDSQVAWNNPSGVTGCGVSGSNYGQYCAGRIMEEGWQMNY